MKNLYKLPCGAMLIMLFAGCYIMPGYAKGKKHLFETGYNNYKDLELVTKTIQADSGRVTVIRSSSYSANPIDLLRRKKFIILSEPVPCNSKHFADIISNAHEITRQFLNLGYNMDSGIHFVVEDQHLACAYYFEHENSSLTFIARKK